MLSVKGKWALITGASRGIGRLTALYMAQHRCNLVLHSRQLEHTEKLLEEVEALGVEAYGVQAELANLHEVVDMLDAIENKGTAVDIVFNNAAVQVGYRSDYWQTPIEDFDLSFRINTIAVAAICYRLILPMIERGFGRIINTTSGIKNQPEQAGYSASKAALDKFTTDLGTKLEGTNVLINLTDP
ncbi:MAG: SDR family oxidoreductase, partial [Methanosarcinaceae archaeon]|nr:SDR family oxidoreductase [Methanosarcinaceae archaeon]